MHLVVSKFSTAGAGAFPTKQIRYAWPPPIVHVRAAVVIVAEGAVVLCCLPLFACFMAMVGGPAAQAGDPPQMQINCTQHRPTISD